MQTTDIMLKTQGMSFQVDKHIYFKDLELELPVNTWTSLLGTSGVGKSSILKILAGLMPKEFVDSNYQANFTNDSMSYMAQQDCLMPWLTVLNNVLLGASLRNEKKSNLKLKALELLEQVGLSEKINAYSAELSGGMRQRVALVRTLMEDKPIVLMDEPFSALDALTKLSMQNLAFKLLQNKTVLLVTHDPWEALRLSHQIAILKGNPAKLSFIESPNNKPLRDSSDPALMPFHQTILDALLGDGHG